ncbi:MAG TPA: molybdopterin dinucleotide binding domain-containing protein, partial [Mycobacteriales bacterium]|nr:molybdopterin dinucleotide binding domain-containing protein [Mycobacteriales bacterium]
AGGNPFHHHQDLNRLLAAWQRPATVVVHDVWWTATARHADIVLPATTTLERNDIAASSRDRYIVAMHQAVPARGLARNDHDIFRDLAGSLGVEAAFTEGLDEMGWLRRMYGIFSTAASARGVPVPDFDQFWAAGYIEMPDLGGVVPLSAFRADPKANRLETPSGKIELFSTMIAGFEYPECPGHPIWLEPKEWLGPAHTDEFPLHLISNQPRNRLHSQLGMTRLSRRANVAGREPLRMNPEDAAARDIKEGDLVLVYNHRGRMLAGAHLDAGIRNNVVQVATGAWYDPERPGEIGALDKHGNPNVLTGDRCTSRLGQGPAAHSALVQVTKWDGPVPEVTAFDPPEFEPPGGRGTVS